MKLKIALILLFAPAVVLGQEFKKYCFAPFAEGSVVGVSLDGKHYSPLSDTVQTCVNFESGQKVSRIFFKRNGEILKERGIEVKAEGFVNCYVPEFSAGNIKLNESTSKREHCDFR